MHVWRWSKSGDGSSRPRRIEARGRCDVEGVNIIALLLGNLALVIFGMAFFVALGLLIARMTKAARLFFAVAMLCASVIAAVAILSFLQAEFHESELLTRIVLPA